MAPWAIPAARAVVETIPTVCFVLMGVSVRLLLMRGIIRSLLVFGEGSVLHNSGPASSGPAHVLMSRHYVLDPACGCKQNVQESATTSAAQVCPFGAARGHSCPQQRLSRKRANKPSRGCIRGRVRTRK